MLGPAMLGPAARLALGAGDLMPAAAGLPGRLLALLGPVLVLGAAALLVLRGLRRGRAAPGPRRIAEEEEEGDGPPGIGRPTARELPALQPGKQRRREQVPMNGQLISSANTREKKLLKPKKKRKARCSDKEVPKDLPVEKDKVQEEEGVWQTKISSREKRNLRKERLKQKDPSRAPLSSLAAEPAFDWDEKGAVWPLTEDTSGGGKSSFTSKAECGTMMKTLGSIREELAPSQSEEDVFSNVGTWDMAEVRSCPVTFGTLSELPRELDNMKNKSSEDSPSRCCWHASSAFLPADSAWQGQDDPSAIDIDSDWKAPTEEWGNWTGDEEHQTGDKEKDLPKGKADIHFCLSGLKSKTQRKKKKIEVKEERSGAGLRHGKTRRKTVMKSNFNILIPSKTNKQKSQQGLETRMEEDPRDLISTKHTSDEVCAYFRKSLGIANNVPNNSVPGKKERRKRKKMKKET